MQIVVNIDEDRYKSICDGVEAGIRVNMPSLYAHKIIANGTPLPKGHWIDTGDYYTGAYGTINYVKCSCCGEDSLEEGNYCPNCGADMREVEE